MFSTTNGLYERARKRFKIQDGIKLFTYSFYKQRREDVQARPTGACFVWGRGRGDVRAQSPCRVPHGRTCPWDHAPNNLTSAIGAWERGGAGMV